MLMICITFSLLIIKFKNNVNLKTNFFKLGIIIIIKPVKFNGRYKTNLLYHILNYIYILK